MQEKIRSVIIYFAIFILLITAVLYFLYGHQFVHEAYSGNAPDWFNNLVDFLYPRFQIEKKRLPLNFFIAKADQIVIRICLVLFGLIAVLIIKSFNRDFSNTVERVTSEKTNLHNLLALRMIFYILLIIVTREVYADLKALGSIKAFYKPLFVLDLIDAPFPGKRASFIIYGVIFFSSIMVVFGIKSVIFSVLALLGFLTYQAYLYSFEKIDHGYGPLTYCCMLFPFLLAERVQAKKEKRTELSSWSLRLILIVICFCYFISGVEKLLIGGLDWLNPLNFRTYLSLHGSKLGMQVASSDLLCIALPLGALLFELTFPLILVYRKFKWVFLIAGVIFHVGTVLLLNISSFENPWVFTYIFFIDWTKLGSYLSRLPSYFRN